MITVTRVHCAVSRTMFHITCRPATSTVMVVQVYSAHDMRGLRPLRQHSSSMAPPSPSLSLIGCNARTKGSRKPICVVVLTGHVCDASM